MLCAVLTNCSRKYTEVDCTIPGCARCSQDNHVGYQNYSTYTNLQTVYHNLALPSCHELSTTKVV